MRRRLTPALLAAALVLASGCTSNDPPQPQPAPTTPPTLSMETRTECASVERAYNVWNTMFVPDSAETAAELSGFMLESLQEEGKKLMDAVNGYNDRPSKALAVAVADYNYQLALARADLLTSETVSQQQATAVAGAAEQIHSDFSAFKTTTCTPR